MIKSSRLAGFLEWCSVVVVVVMFGTVVLQVVGRYFLEVAPPWTEEVGRYLLVWLVAIGAGIYLRRDDGYRGAVDFIVNAMTTRSKHTLVISLMLFVVLFLVLLVIKTFQLVLKNTEVRSAALELPMSYVYLGVLVMAVLMLWGLSHHLRKEIKALMGRGQEQEMEASAAPTSPSEDREA